MASVPTPSPLQNSPYGYSLSEKRNRVHGFGRRFTLIGTDSISDAIVFDTKEGHTFHLTCLVQRANPFSYIPRQLIELLKLNKLCWFDSNGTYIILQLVTNGKRGYDKFYVYPYAGEVRLSTNLSQKLGLVSSSYASTAIPRGFDDHNPRRENLAEKLASFDTD